MGDEDQIGVKTQGWGLYTCAGAGEARWRATNVTAQDLNALIEKGLLWSRDDTSRRDVHYAFTLHSPSFTLHSPTPAFYSEQNQVSS